MKIAMPLDAFRAAVKEKREQMHRAARPAAQAGVQVIYDAALAKVPVGTEAHFFYGTSYKKTGQRYLFYPGDLKRSIYQAYSERDSGYGKAVYNVSWNSRKVPYAWMVEFGTSRTPAQPFMGPAIIENRSNAAIAMRERYILEMKK